MKNAVSKLLIGASIAAGMSAIGSAPAHAISLTFNNPKEIKTYTGGSDGKFIKEDTSAAVKALTDKDSSSNVELWYSTENPTSNVGFTAKEGKYSATVSSVTADDWNNFQDVWLNDLLSTYTPFQSVWNGFGSTTKTLVKGYLPLLGMGDPNIGSFQFGQNGGVELKLVGHMDVKTKLGDELKNKTTELTAGTNKITTVLGTVTQALSFIDLQLLNIDKSLASPLTSPLQVLTLKRQKASLTEQKTVLTNQKTALTEQLNPLTALLGDLTKFQTALNGYKGSITASEIAKVVTGGKIYYAYGFDPTASGITASDDGVSYSATYTWKTKDYVPKKAPEPSVVLGMLGVAGVFAVQRKRKKALV